MQFWRLAVRYVTIVDVRRLKVNEQLIDYWLVKTGFSAQDTLVRIYVVEITMCDW